MRIFLVALIFSIFVSGCSMIRKQVPEFHPFHDLDEKSWHNPTQYEYTPFVDPDGSKVLWHVGVFYQHSESSWTRSEHYFFGELVMRAYGLDLGGKLVEHWIEVKKGEKWNLVKTNSPEFKLVKGPSGRLIAVVIVLKGKNGREVLSREVKRKF